MRKITFYSIVFFSMISCSSSKNIKQLKHSSYDRLSISIIENDSLLNEAMILKELENRKIERIIEMQKSQFSFNIKEDDWKKDRKALLDELDSYISTNVTIRDNSQRANTWLVVAGTGIGVIGGTYGLVSDNDDVVAGITSLVAGGLTTVISQLNIKNKEERAKTCINMITEASISFKQDWPESGCPKNNTQLTKYYNDRRLVYSKIKDAKCFQ